MARDQDGALPVLLEVATKTGGLHVQPKRKPLLLRSLQCTAVKAGRDDKHDQPQHQGRKKPNGHK